MNEEELKRYKEQIERLKREFHKDSPHNIENPSEFIPKKTVVSVSEKTASNPLLTELKNIGNVSKDENIPVKTADSVIEDLTKNETSEPIENLEKPSVLETKPEQIQAPAEPVKPIEFTAPKPEEPITSSTETVKEQLKNPENFVVETPTFTEPKPEVVATPVEPEKVPEIVVEQVKVPEVVFAPAVEIEKAPEIVVEQEKAPEVNVAPTPTYTEVKPEIVAAPIENVVKPIETPIVKPAETWNKPFEDSNKGLVKEPAIVAEIKEIGQNIPPIIPPITASGLAADEEHKKSSILKYVSLIVGILVLGVVAFYFYNRNVTNDLKHANQVKVEKAFADSVLAYEENLKIQQEIEAKYAEEQAELERLEQERIVFISDTIFNLSELEVATGYYAVIGSFSDMSFAKKFKNKTKYPSVIFTQDKIRMGLKLSDDDIVIFEDLENVRKSYPEAWLLYNRH